MTFEFTPDDAQPIARAVQKHLRKQHIPLEFELAAWDDAPYRTTIVATEGEKKILIEAQRHFDFHKELVDLAKWLMLKRNYSEMYIATAPSASIEAGVLNELRELCVGLMLVSNDNVNIYQIARNPALIVNPDPTLKFGARKAEVQAILQKFNYVDRKDGLRDMCEVVERETEALLSLAIKKGLMTVPASSVAQKDWSEQIDSLASATASKTSTPIIEDKLKIDLHSFRGARNLLDHKTRNKRTELARQRQFAERMAQGPRLLAEILAVARRIAR